MNQGKRAAKETVFVGVLSDNMTQHASHSLLAFHLPIWSADPKFPYSFAYWVEAGRSPQDYKRNKIIGMFLESGCDTLMMIDDDMIVSGTVMDLLGTPDYDIVAPLQYAMKGADPKKGRDTPECIPCAFIADPEHGGKMIPAYPKTSLINEVDFVGSGVMAIKRHVLEDHRMLHASALDPPAFFRNIYEPNGRRSCGLDIDFCKRAKDCGYTVKVNYGVIVGHFKTIDLNEIDVYAKTQFLRGVQIGEKHEVQMEVQESRAGSGADRGSGPRQLGDEGVGPVRLDRAGRRREAREARAKGSREATGA